MSTYSHSGSVTDRAGTLTEDLAAPQSAGRITRPLTHEQHTLRRAQQGDHEALTEIVLTHRRALFGYFCSRLLATDDAEDLCQEVFLRALSGKIRFAGNIEVRPWLIGVARNVLREHIRAVVRRQEVSWTELCLDLESMVEEEQGRYDDVVGFLPSCLSALGPSAREALDLHYRNQLQLSQISEKLCRSLGAVKLLMYRARQAVKRCVETKMAQQSHD